MAYTPTIWETGNVVTADKLNKLENGVENASAGALPEVTNADNGNVLTVVEGIWAKAIPTSEILIVGTTVENNTITLNKTWQEIHDAKICFIILNGASGFEVLQVVEIYMHDGQYAVNATEITCLAESANGYPSCALD